MRKFEHRTYLSGCQTVRAWPSRDNTHKWAAATDVMFLYKAQIGFGFSRSRERAVGKKWSLVAWRKLVTAQVDQGL
jgi:hypothetical protein